MNALSLCFAALQCEGIQATITTKRMVNGASSVTSTSDINNYGLFVDSIAAQFEEREDLSYSLYLNKSTALVSECLQTCYSSMICSHVFYDYTILECVLVEFVETATSTPLMQYSRFKSTFKKIRTDAFSVYPNTAPSILNMVSIALQDCQNSCLADNSCQGIVYDYFAKKCGYSYDLNVMLVANIRFTWFSRIRNDSKINYSTSATATLKISTAGKTTRANISTMSQETRTLIQTKASELFVGTPNASKMINITLMSLMRLGVSFIVLGILIWN
jgi:hypothetical protein